jgi:hypothetical protein
MSVISLKQYANGTLLSTRTVATSLRDFVDFTLSATTNDAVLDFHGLGATTAFIDELVGGLVLRYGPSILTRLRFLGCSEDVRAIIEFVAADRSAKYGSP